MKVLFLPYYQETNPYQRDLAAGLADCGVEVGGPTGGGVLGIVGGLRRYGLPDVVHFHWIYGYVHGRNRLVSAVKGLFFLFQVFVLRLLGVRVVWTVHNLLSHPQTEPDVDLAVRRRFVGLCDAIVVHCDSARELVSETYRLSPAARERCHVVHHGHYLDAYPNDVSREDAREALGLAPDDRVALYFGRIYAYKNVPALVEAFATVDDERARLLVVGDPGDDALRSDLERLAGRDERVRTVFEFVAADEIQQYMNAADVVALPFASILTSGSVMLAASFGKPVVAPNVGCVGEFLGEGLVYDPDDPDGLRETLADALADDCDREAVGRANLAAAHACDWESMAALTAAAYRGESPATSEERSGVAVEVQ